MSQEAPVAAGTRVHLTRKGLELGTETLPLVAGSMHYWRVDHRDWDRCLGGLAELGLRIVSSYVPWGVHELDKGRFDFGGRKPEHRLLAFLDAAARRGLRAILRPGPHINAELTRFGYPARLLDRKEVLARGPDGGAVVLPYLPRMFPVPSYASSAFYEEAGVFFDAFAREVRDHLAPQGPVAAIQSDNEMCLFFRTSPYDQDYHPEAVELYRTFLRERYQEGLDRLSTAYGRAYRSWDSLYPPAVPPLGPGDLPAHRDWVEFKGYLMAHGVRRVRLMLEERGLAGIPYLHNLPAATRAPFDIGRMERGVDACGLDFYARREDAGQVRDAVLALSAQSRFPWLPEFSGGGFMPWGGLRTPQDMLFCLSVALACGARGFNLFMAVERDRFYGAPITVRGLPRPGHWDAARRILALFERARLHELERAAPVLLLARRRDELDACLANPWTPLSPFLLPMLGLPEEAAVDPVLPWGATALAAREALSRWRAALDTAQVPYALADTRLPPERGRAFPLLVLPAPLPDDPEEREGLLEMVRQGARLLTIPGNLLLPDMEKRKPGEFAIGAAARVLPARLVGDGWVVGIDTDAACGLVPELAAAFGIPRAGRVEGIGSSWFLGPDAAGGGPPRRVLAAANLEPGPRRGALRDVGPGRALDLWTGADLGTAEGLDIELPGMTVGFWEITNDVSSASRARTREA